MHMKSKDQDTSENANKEIIVRTITSFPNRQRNDTLSQQFRYEVSRLEKSHSENGRIELLETLAIQTMRFHVQQYFQPSRCSCHL